MCGRTQLTVPFRVIASLYRAEYSGEQPWGPSLDVRPTQVQAVIRQGDSGRELALLKWGLIPFWSKDKSIANKTFNARSEEVEKKPAFRAAFKSRRCLVVVTGFYEWTHRENEPGKRKYLFQMPQGKPFAFAGLWESWTDKSTGEIVESCTILTKAAEGKMRDYHERMPVLIDGEDADAWIDPKLTDPVKVKDLLHAKCAEKLDATDVTGVPMGNTKLDGG